MKKLFVIILALGVTLAVSNLGWAQCATIEDGTIVSSTGEPVTLGYDEFGYNYQAHMYNGRLCDYDRVPGGEDCLVDLIMKWNDAWLSNKSCDDDNLLDRHFGYPTYTGSGAWLTNHQSGRVEVNGKMRKWTYFVKIVTPDANATKIGAFWYTPDGREIGPIIWGAFAIIQEVVNDPSEGLHGVVYNSPVGPGLGKDY